MLSDGVHAPALTQAQYCLFVTKVFAIWNVLTVTWCCGCVYGNHSVVWAVPILKLPPGIVTHSIPALSRRGFAFLTAAEAPCFWDWSVLGPCAQADDLGQVKAATNKVTAIRLVVNIVGL